MNLPTKQVILGNRVCLLTINGQRWIGDSTWVVNPDLVPTALASAAGIQLGHAVPWRDMADGWYLLTHSGFKWQKPLEIKAAAALTTMFASQRLPVTGVDIMDDCVIQVGPHAEAVYAAHTEGPDVGHGRWTLLEALNSYGPPNHDASEERFHLHVIRAELRFHEGMKPATATIGTWREEPAWLIAGVDVPMLQEAA